MDRVHRKGIAHSEGFCRAFDRLQAAGFIIELWVDPKNQVVTLRWVREGAKWHVTGQGMKQFGAIMEQLGRSANYWCTVRENGSGNECNYAVHEV